MNGWPDHTIDAVRAPMTLGTFAPTVAIGRRVTTKNKWSQCKDKEKDKDKICD